MNAGFILLRIYLKACFICYLSTHLYGYISYCKFHSCSRPPIGLSLYKDHYGPFRCKATAELERLPQQLTALYKLEYASLTKADLDSQIMETLSSVRVIDAEVQYVDKSTVNQV